MTDSTITILLLAGALAAAFFAWLHERGVAAFWKSEAASFEEKAKGWKVECHNEKLRRLFDYHSNLTGRDP